MAKTGQQASPETTIDAYAALLAPFDVRTLSKVNADALKAFLESNTKLLEAGSAVNAEVVDFVGRRLEHDAAVGECLVDCKSVDEAYEVYTDFFQTAIADYLTEMRKLMAIGAGVLNGSASVFKRDVEAAAKPAKASAPSAE
jgi:hypothetical protein